MRAGQLRHIVVLQQPVETTEADGSRTVTWANVQTCWAKVSPMNGRELAMAQQINAEISTEIELRSKGADVQPDWRVVFGPRVYDILAVINEDERGIRTRLLCRQGLNDG